DLRYDPLKPVRLRVSPPGEPWVANGPQGYRRLVTWTSGAQVPRVAPGRYTVRLTVDGKSSTQPVEVLADPKSVGKPEQIEAQVNFLNGLVSQLNQAADLIIQLEWARLQLQQTAQRLTGTPNSDAAIKSAHDLEERAIAAEDQLVDVHLTGRTEDSFRHPMKLYGKMLSMLENLGASGADLPATNQQIAVNQDFQQRLAAAQRAAEQVLQQVKSNNPAQPAP